MEVLSSGLVYNLTLKLIYMPKSMFREYTMTFYQFIRPIHSKIFKMKELIDYWNELVANKTINNDNGHVTTSSV